MKKFEYNFGTYTFRDFNHAIATLNAAGEQGWEVMTFIHGPDGHGQISAAVFFKRVVDAREEAIEQATRKGKR